VALPLYLKTTRYTDCF